MSPESEASGRAANQDSFANRIIKRMLRRVVNHRLGQPSRWVLRAAECTARLQKPLGLALPTTRALMRRMSQGPSERNPERAEMPLARMISTGSEAVELSEEPVEAPYEASSISLAPPAEVKRLSFDEMTAILQRNTEEMKAGKSGRAAQRQPPTSSIPSASVAGQTEPAMPAGKPLAVAPTSQSGVKRVPRNVRVQELTPASTSREDNEPQLGTPAPTPSLSTQPKPAAIENRVTIPPLVATPPVAHKAPEPLVESGPAPVQAEPKQDILPTEERRLATIGRVRRTSATPPKGADATRTSSQPVVAAIRRMPAIQPAAAGENSARLATRSAPEAPQRSLPPANRVQQARIASREPGGQQAVNTGQESQAQQAASSATGSNPVASQLFVDETGSELPANQPFVGVSRPSAPAGLASAAGTHPAASQTPAAATPSEPIASPSLAAAAPTPSARAPLRRTRKPKPELVDAVIEGAVPEQPGTQAPLQSSDTGAVSGIGRTASTNFAQVQPPERAAVVSAITDVPVTQAGQPEVTPVHQVSARRVPQAKSSPAGRKRPPESAQPVARIPEASQPDEALAGIPLEEALGLSPRTIPAHFNAPGVELSHSDPTAQAPDANGLELHREPLHQALFGSSQPLSTHQIVRASVARIAREERTPSAASLSQAGVSDGDVIPVVNVQLIRRRAPQSGEVGAAGSYETALPLRRSVTVEQVEATTSQTPASSSGEGAASSTSSGAPASTTEAASTPTAASAEAPASTPPAASAQAPASTPAAGGVGQMDIQELTEEVYRRLRDIIRIEEERYGHQRDRW